MTRFSEVLQEELVANGASRFFGFPGESTLGWYAAAQAAGRQHVCARCERCAGYMADAYARVSGSVPVVDAPGGVGSPYLVPALHEALNSSVPMVAMVTDAGADPRAAWRTSTCDNTRMLGAVSKAVVRIDAADQIAERAAEALVLARGGRPGPVTLLVRDGLLDTDVPAGGHRRPRASGTTASADHADGSHQTELRVVLERLLAAQRPLLICGGGTHAAAAYRRVALLAEQLGAAVAVTFNGMGAIPATHPLYLGTVGAKGQPESNAYAAAADAVLWLGSKRGDKTTQYGALPHRDAWSAVIDIDPTARFRAPAADLHITADLDVALKGLLDLVDGPAGGRRRPAVPVRPQPAAGTVGWLLELAGRALPVNSVVVADASKASSWIGAFVAPRRVGRFILAPRGSGAIGWGLPAALGAAIARPTDAVLAVVGDGGYLMAAHELEVAARLNLDVTVLILNNRRLELLDQVGQDRYGPAFGLPESTADLSVVSRGFGVPAYDAADPAEAYHLISQALEGTGPRVINCAMPAFAESPDLTMYRQRRQVVAW